MNRLAAQMQFLLTCDQLKNIIRTTTLHNGSRMENSAEHSWHLALMALTLAEHAPAGTDMNRVIQLLLLHDLVEIYAGDTFFDVSAADLQQQAEQEWQAAKQLFGLLPEDQQKHFLDLFEEFETQKTPEAQYARALDALQPMLLTWGQGGLGCTEKHPDLTMERLLKLKEKHLRRFPVLWEFVLELLQDAVKAGILHSTPGAEENASEHHPA
ncbi:HD domain-containing protein [Deinococcus roseus]|uniref:Phosphohydrolase n=1 Tax=Deinococcus roseus TaxID=392414 RepID=A0ABQ2CXR3_9DEIO|nr:HD domain-containing protein [Deinococcus roseus]GGJ27070.1 phosphohydrolase [Deinococcus roseus]